MLKTQKQCFLFSCSLSVFSHVKSLVNVVSVLPLFFGFYATDMMDCAIQKALTF